MPTREQKHAAWEKAAQYADERVPPLKQEAVTYACIGSVIALITLEFFSLISGTSLSHAHPSAYNLTVFAAFIAPLIFAWHRSRTHTKYFYEELACQHEALRIREGDTNAQRP